MLKTFRNFSTSIYSKIFLFIVAIPFVFWGMGDLFSGGNLNTIVKIEKDKILTEEFVNFIKYNSTNEDDLNDNFIKRLLYNFIGEKLIGKEIEDFGIKLSDASLGLLIKNEKKFKKDNKFSRIKYEKFLVENGLGATVFEKNYAAQIKKDQLYNLIGGGVIPSNFIINIDYDKINQKRDIEVVNLNDVFQKKLIFSEKKIKEYFDQNKDNFIKIYKSIKFINLNPKNLSESNEFNNLFFEKIDKIDDLIVEGKNLNFIIKEFNLEPFTTDTFDQYGINIKAETTKALPKELIKKVFNISETEATILAQHKDKYFVIELVKTESIQRKIEDKSVKKEILFNLKKQAKRKLIANLINKINKQNFKKNDFDKFIIDEAVSSKKIKLQNKNDKKILKQELIEQVYAFSEKKVIVVTDISLNECYLIYIEKIENSYIDKNSKDYKKYLNLAKVRMTNNIYATYDIYLQKKYEIDINNKALDRVKNLFR